MEQPLEQSLFVLVVFVAAALGAIIGNYVSLKRWRK
jgi:uncharacterized protein YneF (UPF0154 family)